ncbi:hypothetical protein V6N13_130352 [Hibiscus sabdariffa]
MVGRRARKRLGGAANYSITKFPISGKVPLEWLMHRSASPSPGHAQSVGGVRDPYSANHSRLWSYPAWQQYWWGVSGPSNVRASDLIKSQWVLLLRHPAHPCPDPTPLKKQQQQ